MRKTILLILLVLFLSACSAATEAPVSMEALPTSTAVATLVTIATPTSASTNADSRGSPELQTYLQSVDRILGNIAEAGAELDELFYMASANMDLLTNDSWVKLANDALDRMNKGADELVSISPVPAEAEEAHKYFLLAAEEMHQVVFYQHEVIKGDFDSAYTVTDHMRAHLNYAEMAFDEIQKIQP